MRSDATKEVAEYDSALAELKTAYEHVEDPLKTAGRAVLNEIIKAKSDSEPQDARELIGIIQAAIPVVKGPKKDAKAYPAHIQKLGIIVKELNRTARWKALAGALLILGGVALITAGILLAIPSGGSSLLAVVLGAKAIAVTGTTAAGIGTGVVLAGSGSTYFGQKMRKKIKLIKSLDALRKAAEKEKYIEVPFPPDFFLTYCAHQHSAALQSYANLAEPVFYSPRDIEKMFSEENKELNKVVIDAPRIAY